MRERTIWIAAGLLGLVVAVALAVLTSSVSQPPVGAPGEPVSAGRQLAPARTTTTARAARPQRVKTTTMPAQAPVQGDDGGSNSSGSGSRSGDDSSGKGRGRGRGGDD